MGREWRASPEEASGRTSRLTNDCERDRLHQPLQPHTLPLFFPKIQITIGDKSRGRKWEISRVEVGRAREDPSQRRLLYHTTTVRVTRSTELSTHFSPWSGPCRSSVARARTRFPCPNYQVRVSGEKVNMRFSPRSHFLNIYFPSCLSITSSQFSAQLKCEKHYSSEWKFVHTR